MKATLTLRCSQAGCKLIEVIYEQGKPFAYCNEIAYLALMHDDEGGPHPRKARTRWDLLEEYPHSTTVQVGCKCGSRFVSLNPLTDMIKEGRTGKVLTVSTTC
jgi:hypothetical protein